MIRRYTLIVTFLAFTWSTILRSAVAASRVHPMDTAISAALVRGIGRALHCFTRWTGNICGFVTLLTDNDVELHDLAISDATYGFPRIIFNDCRLQLHM